MAKNDRIIAVTYWVTSDGCKRGNHIIIYILTISYAYLDFDSTAVAIFINFEFYFLYQKISFWILFYSKRRGREYSQVMLDICEYEKRIWLVWFQIVINFIEFKMV